MTESMTSLGSFVITPKESGSFAALSGDFNPLHLDPILARRYQFGSTVIHGINGTLRALDTLLASQRGPVLLASLRVRFNKPVQQDHEIECLVQKMSGTSERIELFCHGKIVQTIELSLLPRSHLDTEVESIAATKDVNDVVPNNIAVEQARDLNGSVDLVWNPALFAEIFPELSERIPAAQCATILGTTKIVGMVCPGLNSIYTSLNLTFDCASRALASQLEYRVESVDSRFSRVVMAVFNTTALGEIESFFRPPPIKQAAYLDIKALVQESQFIGYKALIVGGSRGLGETTAKVLSAGGASTTITFANGREDAVMVANEINAAGGECQLSKLDIHCGEAPENIFEVSQKITHIFYMASPLIEKNDSRLWNSGLFQKFSEFYVHGLASLLMEFMERPEYRKGELNVFIPSTIFLDNPERGFAEYTVAKAATESFAEQIRLKCPKWRVCTPRLPRMLTDQTAGVAGLSQLDTARLVLATLAELQL